MSERVWTRGCWFRTVGGALGGGGLGFLSETSPCAMLPPPTSDPAVPATFVVDLSSAGGLQVGASRVAGRRTARAEGCPAGRDTPQSQSARCLRRASADASDPATQMGPREGPIHRIGMWCARFRSCGSRATGGQFRPGAR